MSAKSELNTGRIGLGCMGLARVYGSPDLVEARRTVDAALEAGVTMFDTADMYGGGSSERVLGSWLHGRRDRAVLATKTGITTRFGGLPTGINARPERISRAIDASLARLQTDYVDLYYLHRVDPDVPIEDSVGAISDLVKAGKVRHIGLSEVTADEISRAAAVHPIAAVQSEWSLFTRGLERDIVPAARAVDALIVPYSPLGRGMLTGTPESTTRLPLFDYRRFLPRWRRANLAANLALVARVAAIGEQIGASPAQVALAWLLHRGDDVVPIPGMTRRRSLSDNLGALKVQLSTEHLEELDTVRPSGLRYGRRGALVVLPEDR